MNIKFAAHLDTLLTDLTPEERLRAFARMGFAGAELWCHWDYNVADLARTAVDAGIALVAVATEFIPLTRKDRHADYLAGLKRTVTACRTMNCRTVISQVGDLQDDLSPDYQQQYVINGLRAAAPIVAAAGITLVIEPLNVLVDHRGYFLTRSDMAADIITAVDSPNVKMLFDVYHQQITEGHLIANISKYLPLIGHFHFADNPGRHQPGTGEINFVNVFKTIADSPYDGWVGMEFLPVGDHRAVLDEFRREFMTPNL